jgi:hypothetical protein
MRKLLTFACLFLALTAGSAFSADADDPLKDVPMYPHPQDFATAQQLALQNRQDRVTMLQDSITCIQQATTMDDIHACQNTEGKSLKKIRLSYCDTDLSWPIRKGAAKRATAGMSPKPTECQRAMAAITGQKIVKPGSEDAPGSAGAPTADQQPDSAQ